MEQRPAAQPTKQQLTAALQITMAVAETIREKKEIPSGELYAILMPRMSLADYQALIRTLKGAGLVTEAGSLLTWIRPRF